jgi:hypothetical protein
MSCQATVSLPTPAPPLVSYALFLMPHNSPANSRRCACAHQSLPRWPGLDGISPSTECAHDYLSHPHFNPSPRPRAPLNPAPLHLPPLPSVCSGHRSSEIPTGERANTLPYLTIWRHLSTAFISPLSRSHGIPLVRRSSCHRALGTPPTDEVQRRRLSPPPMRLRGRSFRQSFLPRRPTKWVARTHRILPVASTWLLVASTARTTGPPPASASRPPWPCACFKLWNLALRTAGS